MFSKQKQKIDVFSTNKDACPTKSFTLLQNNSISDVNLPQISVIVAASQNPPKFTLYPHGVDSSFHGAENTCLKN